MIGYVSRYVVGVDRQHAVVSALRSETATHLLLGLTGLAVVVGTFWTAYTPVVDLTIAWLGTLSSTAIVWLFLVAWLLVWVALEMVVEFAG